MSSNANPVLTPILEKLAKLKRHEESAREVGNLDEANAFREAEEPLDNGPFPTEEAAVAFLVESAELETARAEFDHDRHYVRFFRFEEEELTGFYVTSRRSDLPLYGPFQENPIRDRYVSTVGPTQQELDRADRDEFWCRCGEEETFGRFEDDGECSCGVRKHHYHCGTCGRINQIG